MVDQGSGSFQALPGVPEEAIIAFASNEPADGDPLHVRHLKIIATKNFHERLKSRHSCNRFACTYFSSPTQMNFLYVWNSLLHVKDLRTNEIVCFSKDSRKSRITLSSQKTRHTRKSDSDDDDSEAQSISSRSVHKKHNNSCITDY